MYKKHFKRNLCCLFFGAILIGTITSCEKKSEKVSSEKEHKVSMNDKPQIKEVPVPGQMTGHGGMVGHEGMAGHGGDVATMRSHGGMPGGGMGAHGGMTPEMDAGDLAAPFKAKRKSVRTVDVPDEVKKKWKEVSINVKDKESGKIEHYKVQLNSNFKIPDTDLEINVGVFLPHFSMLREGKITSVSAKPENPALEVTVTENGAEKYRGWLFAKFPDMHAFEHGKYTILLDNEF